MGTTPGWDWGIPLPPGATGVAPSETEQKSEHWAMQQGMMIFPSVMNINAHGYLLWDGISVTFQ